MSSCLLTTNPIRPNLSIVNTTVQSKITMSNTNPFIPGAGANSGPSVEPGVHPAVCVGLFDIGTHIDEQFGKTKRKYVLQFELPDQPPVKRDGQPDEPRCLSKTFTASMHPKGQLRPTIESWFGKSFPSDEVANTFDVSKMVGRPCQLNVLHQENKGKTYANIATILPAPKGQQIVAKTVPTTFTVAQLESTEDLRVAELPEWLEKKVAASEEYKKLLAAGSQAQSSPDDWN